MAVNQANLLDIILRQKGNDSGYRFCGLADQAAVEGITGSKSNANTIYIAQKKMGSKGYPYKIFDNEGKGSALLYVKDEQYKKIQGKVAGSLAQILNDKEEREKHSFQHRATEGEFKDVKEEQPVVYIADKYTENRLGHAGQIFYTDGSKSILFYVSPGTYKKIQPSIESKAAKKDDSDEIRAFKETLEEFKSAPLNNENSVEVNERIEEIVKFIEKISENSSNISSVNKDALAAVKKEAQKFKFELYDYILVNDLRERIANFSIELSKAKGQAEIVELKEAMLTNVDKVQDVSAKEELRKEVITIATKRIQHEILAQTLKIEADGTQRYNFKVVALDIVNSDKKENSHTVSVAERIDTESGAFICYRCKIEKEVDGEFRKGQFGFYFLWDPNTQI